MGLDVDAVLAGPRGRRLRFELARGTRRPDGVPEVDRLRQAAFWAAHALDPGRGTSSALLTVGTGPVPDPPTSTPADVARLVAAVPLAPLGSDALLDALAAAVDNARYWQEPDGEDVLAGTPEVRAALRRVAAGAVSHPAARWWTTPVDRAAQWTVTPEGDAVPGSPADDVVPRPPEGDAVPGAPGGGAAHRLARWRAGTVEGEARAARERPADPRASWSGEWWSTPPRELTRTTRALDAAGPVGLHLAEDADGADRAATQRVDPPADAAVLELDSPEAWLDLCRRHPLDVTASRRHDWYRTTGTSTRWVLPDWSAVAREVDAVHLTVGGYLATAGRALPLGDGRATTLAGWDPDCTYWLVDVPDPRQPAEAWERDESGVWSRVRP